MIAIVLVLALQLLARSWRSDENEPHATAEGTAGSDRQAKGPAVLQDVHHVEQTADRPAARDATPFPPAETPWEEAAFALAELEGRDIVRCALGSDPSGTMDGAGLLLLEHAEVRAGVVTAVLADQVPYEGRATGVVSIGGETFELRLQRAPNAPIASCDVWPSAELSIEDWPQIEHVAPDGTVISEDWAFTALAREDVRMELESLDQEHNAIHALLADPGLSSEARGVLSEWLEARSSALDRAEHEPGTFVLR